MGYRQAKKQVLDCLADGHVEHALDRYEIDVKNLLLTGVVTIEQVANAIARSSGTEYKCSSHHLVGSIEVHIIKTHHGDRNWYIKWYFVAPNAVFISVHE